MNIFVIMGRLVKDTEVKTVPSVQGKKILSFTVAVDRDEVREEDKQNGRQAADYFIVEKWVDVNSKFENYLRKGQQVVVLGQLRQDKSKDENGNWKNHPAKITMPKIDLVGSSTKTTSQEQQAPTEVNAKDVPWDIDL